jgi:ABC-type nitrate/sulfonate/bicarbonate transport system substrate-binding protein
MTRKKHMWCHSCTVWFIAVAFLIASCSKKSDHIQDKVVYAMPITVAAIPAYVALEKGYWREEGLEVEAKMFSAGRLAVDALLAKDAEVMSVSETPLMYAIVKGNSIFIVATVTQHKEVKLIARTDHGIRKPEDLRGKRIATLPGTNSDYFMYEFLRANNIKLDQVKIIDLEPPDMVTALVNGDIDAYFAWEPHIYYAQNRIPEKTIVFMPGDLYSGRHCVAMNQEYVRSHPAVVEKLIRGFLRAETFVQENPDSAQAITSKVTGMPVDALKAIWPEYETKVVLDSNLVNILTKEALWARSIDKSTAPLPEFKNFIYLDALSKTRPSSVIF